MSPTEISHNKNNAISALGCAIRLLYDHLEDPYYDCEYLLQVIDTEMDRLKNIRQSIER